MVVNFQNGVGVCANVAVDALGDIEFALVIGTDGCDIFNQVSVDTKLEVKACAKNFDGCAGLDTDAESGHESC